MKKAAHPRPGHRRDDLLDHQRAAAPRQKLAIKQTTRTSRALIKDMQYRLDVNTLHRGHETGELDRVQLQTTVPLRSDSHLRNRTTGSFILVDQNTEATVVGRMID